jgi:RNA polymerase sigma-70 factor (ECF subfamily)
MPFGVLTFLSLCSIFYHLGEDEDILKRVAKGERVAFDELFRKYHRYLVSIAYSYTKDIELSRDLSQEVFLDVWKRRSKLKIDSSFKAFIRRAVINQALTKIKSLKKNDQVSDTVLQISGDSDSSEELNFKELKDKIKQVIMQLPLRCRTVFELSRYEDKSHKEIAKQLDISTKTIENQMTKALKTLRHELKSAGFLTLIILVFRGW